MYKPYLASTILAGKSITLQMYTKEDVEQMWADLDRSNNSLPLLLKPAQRDTLLYILNGKNVLLNVTTGLLSNYSWL